MKKPLYKVGDELVIEDVPFTVTVMEVQEYKAKQFVGEKGRKRMTSGWEYWVRNNSDDKRRKKNNGYWVDEYCVLSKVTFAPSTVTKVRHVELGSELPTYEAVRDYLETLPKVAAKGCHPVDVLKRLVEQAALMVAGDRQESADAKEEVEYLLR